jgi:glycosyltransferase involved in cell wall biosynthesis
MTTSLAGDPRPRISVIIPAYNEEGYLGATLENVHRAIQEYARTHQAPVEVIVVNNNSTDRTEEVAKAYGARILFEKKNQIAAARNAGGKAARGEIVAFLDADDHMSPNLLTLVDAAMSSGRYIGGGAKVMWDRKYLSLMVYHAFNNTMREFLGVNTGLIYTHKESFDAMGGFDERYYAAEEFKFVLALRKLGKRRGKQFAIIRDGHVTKCARKFDQYGGLVILMGLLAFVVNPWLVRSQKACFYWYSKKRSRDGQ